MTCPDHFSKPGCSECLIAQIKAEREALMDQVVSLRRTLDAIEYGRVEKRIEALMARQPVSNLRRLIPKKQPW